MKVTIERYADGQPEDLEAFADKNGLEMEVIERSGGPDSGRFFANFKEAWVMDDGFLLGTYGNGESPDEAIAEYAKRIAGKRLAVGERQRRNLDVPNGFHYTPKVDVLKVKP